MGWTKPHYQQPRTIEQLLNENGEYGIRTGDKINEDYFLNVLIFQKGNGQAFWFSNVNLEKTAFKDISFIDTGTTYHYYLLIKEFIPYSVKLYPRGWRIPTCGIVFARGKQVIGLGSYVDGVHYELSKRKQDWLVFDTIVELKQFLKEQGVNLDLNLNHLKPVPYWEKEKTLPQIEVIETRKVNNLTSVVEPVLNEQQKLAQQLISEGKSIFLTGSAGTGKSFTLYNIIKTLQRKYGVEQVGITATTGIGATLINGTTFHSYLGIGIMGDHSKSVIKTKILTSERAVKNWKRTKALIIDEVSMLSGNLFDKLEEIAREMKNNNQLFGGIQLVLIGDFAQLPPVQDKETDIYVFESEVWKKCIQQTVNLKQIYRQKDDWFIRYLNAIRFGSLTKKKWEDMLNWCGEEPNWPQDGIVPTVLYSTNKEVANLNENKLVEINSASYFYRAVDKENGGEFQGALAQLLKGLVVKESTELKLGAQVMLVHNWHEEELVNGDKGVIVGFEKVKSDQRFPYYPLVQFTSGKVLKVEPVTWEKIEGFNEKSEPIVSASRTQIPLILAWAITIDKSQGQSISRLIVDLKRCWRAGQVYTALSRATDPKYLQILNFSYNRMRCELKVKNFYQQLEGKKITVKKNWQADPQQKSLHDKVYRKWKKWSEVYEVKSKWPYTEIKKWLVKEKGRLEEKEKLINAFTKVIEKSISNSVNLLTYRKLINYLEKWEVKNNSKEV